jgi:hypothetical protein
MEGNRKINIKNQEKYQASQNLTVQPNQDTIDQCSPMDDNRMPSYFLEYHCIRQWSQIDQTLTERLLKIV